MSKIILCDKIESAPLSSIKSMIGGIITFYNSTLGFTQIDDINSAVFTESGQESDPGTLAVQTLDLKCLMLVDSLISITEQPQVFRLQFSDGRTLIWGSLTNPVVKSAIKREVNSTQISFARKSLIFES